MKQSHTVFNSVHTTIDIPTDDDEYEDQWNGLTITEHDVSIEHYKIRRKKKIFDSFSHY